MPESGGAEGESLVAGIDLGGTKLAVALVDADGAVHQHLRYESRPERGPAELIDNAVEAVESLRGSADAPVGAVGVGVAGQVEPETGVVAYAPNLEWSQVPLGSRLADALALPVTVLNDVQAATYGEAVFGAGRGQADVACIFIGTGVGGGLVAGGHLLRGCGGSAGEIGHTVVDLHGPVCRCGGRGCVEAFAGGWALARRARAAAESTADSALRMLIESGRPVTASLVAEAAGRGDTAARRLMDDAREALGAAAVSIVNGFNPCVLVIGGGVIDAVPELLDGIRDAVAARALRAAAERARIVRPELGRHAGAIGAATWARRIATAR